MYRTVAFIHTPCYEITDDRLEPPLGLLYLATFLNRNDYQATITDLASVLKENWSDLIPQADVYGFDTYSSTYYRTLEILQVAKRINPAAITIAGGPHASALPQQVAHDFDFVIIGEGEQCLLTLLNSLNKGERLDSIHHELPIKNLDSLPFPDYNLIDRISYRRLVGHRPSVGIISSRGCPYQCLFCTGSIQGINRWIRYRSPQNFVSEIAHLYNTYGIASFKIQDDIFTLQPKRLREINRLLAPLSIVYRCNARVDLCLNKELLELLYTSGCRHITFGVETGSPRMLARMNKRHTITDVQTAITLAKEVGLIVRANLMVGFPGETWETVQETVDLMLICQPEEYVISAFVPYPGTDPFYHPEHYGIIALEADLSQYFLLRCNRETSYIFRTAELNPQTLTEMRTYMIQELSPYMAWAGTFEGFN